MAHGMVWRVVMERRGPGGRGGVAVGGDICEQ